MTAPEDHPTEAPSAAAEREPISHAEFSRFVQEAQDMRRLAEKWERKAMQLHEACALMNSMVLSGESHSEESQKIVRAALDSK